MEYVWLTPHMRQVIERGSNANPLLLQDAYSPQDGEFLCAFTKSQPPRWKI